MKDILDLIFKSNKFEYKQLNLKSCKDVNFYSIVKREYYIICFLEDLNNENYSLTDKISYELNNDKNLTKEEKANITIIFCIKTNHSILTEKEKRIIFEIEENTIEFKKYVLWFSEHEVLEINDKYIELLKEKNKLSEYICSNSNDFEEFSLRPNNRSGYSLLLRIFIKIPFLTLKNIKPLEGNIHDYINKGLNDLSEQLSDILEIQDVKQKYLEMIDLGSNCESNIAKLINEIELE